MEMWIKVGEEKKKLQGSFRKVMEDILRAGGDNISLLAVNSCQKELRRFKRLWRWYDKDLKELARNVLIKYYRSDQRKIKRKIKELKKKARYISKGQIFYCKDLMEKVKEYENQIKEIEEKINDLINTR